ncbi:MAG: hypothetical protein KA190_31305, partial [Kofleriaceae bacterium]|nr:hypothetical protein [Kofleriaceae bacterium]
TGGGESMGGDAAPAAGGAYPTAVIDRPLNIPKGTIELAPKLGVTIPDEGDTQIGITLGARYGINDKLEALLSYGLGISPSSDGKGPLTVGVGYSVLDDGKLSVEPKVAMLYDLNSEIAVLLAGADVRYKISDKLWVGTPMNQPGLALTVKGIDIGTGEIKPMSFIIPLAVGFQVTPQIHAQLNTQLISIAINEDAGDTTFFGADYIPVDLQAVYGLSSALDVTAGINLGDVSNFGAIGINVGANYRL